MLTRFVRNQLIIFTIASVVGIAVMVMVYMQAPTLLGIGRITVKLELPRTGGLYQFSNVTYRGVTVGRVESVGLTNDGIVAHMRLNSGTPVPDNVTATVKSVSAVGEQYIDLVPPENPSSEKLPTARTSARTARRSARTSPGCSTSRNGSWPVWVIRACRTCSARRSRPSTDPDRNSHG